MSSRALLLVIAGAVILLAAAFAAMRSGRKGRDLDSQGGTFSVLQGNVDGRRVVAMIDMGLRDSSERQGLPFFLSISTTLIDPTSDGLPTGNDADSLNSWEDAVEARLQSACRFVFVGRVTWNGHRELLYYLAARQPAIDNLEKLVESHSTRPFAFVCERDEKWTNASFWLDRN